MITHEELLSILSYDKVSGLFTAVKDRGSRIKKGQIAGTINKAGYIQIQISNKIYYGHRLAWFYEHKYMPKLIDHKNRDKADNRIDNLREATKSTNARNVGLRSDNKSGTAGVFWSSKHKLWISNIRIDNKSKHIGYFKDKEEAIKARKDAEIGLGYVYL